MTTPTPPTCPCAAGHPDCPDCLGTGTVTMEACMDLAHRYYSQSAAWQRYLSALWGDL